MVCKNICKTSPIRVNHGGRERVGFGGKIYAKGVKKCTHCDTYLRTDRVRCICCNMLLRYTCRNSEGRKKENELDVRY